jgi:RNA polymerase sigma-70 factor (ECF subfamily)
MSDPNGEGPRCESQANRPDVAMLVAEHHEAVYRYAYRLCGSAADAEDLAQTTFLAAQQKLDQLRDPQRAKSWLLAVVRNAFLKNKRRHAPTAAVDLQLDVATIADELPDDEPFDSERLQQALDELPDEFKIAVTMFYFEQRSYKEIAQELDVPAGTVMSRLSRAKSHLRRRMLGQQIAAERES